MAYDKHTWTCDEPITVERLNHIEDGIANAGGDCGYECDETEVTFFNGSITTTDTGYGYANGTFTPSQAINTDTLTVTLNGTESVLPKVKMYGSVFYGEFSEVPVFTNYPCFVDPSHGRFSTENAGTFTVKMQGTIESVTVTNCFAKAVKLFMLEHILDGEANGSLRSNTSAPEESGYTLGEGAVALGNSTEASGDYSHAEGNEAVASGECAVAFGNTQASGDRAFACGDSCRASGLSSVAVGRSAEATRAFAFAEGDGAKATGRISHAQGQDTIAQGLAQTAIGKYNVAQGTPASIANTDYAFIIGNGTSDANRSNAFAIKWDGTFVFADGTETTPAQFAALKALL